MIYVNILTLAPYSNFLHQLDIERFKGRYIFYENSSLDIVWDMVIIHEGLNNEISIKVKKNGLLFISGEPPLSRVYPKQFIRQFDSVISSHTNLKHPNNIIDQQALNWHFGFDMNTCKYKYNFNDLKKLEIPKKTKNISLISSSQRMLPGHNQRMEIIKVLLNNFPEDIDFYGKDINPIDDKSDAILPYRFHICIENSFIPNYWSEKFADPLLGYSVPIYAGCTNMSKYFDENAYINFNISEPNSLCEIISSVLKDPLKIYEEKIKYIHSAREKLLNDYNIFPVIVSHFELVQSKQTEIIEKKILPVNNFLSHKIYNYNLRAKRFLYKSYFNFLKR